MGTDAAELSEELPLESVGQVLRRAREECNLTIAQIAEKSRISQRHLKLIEKGEFACLPGRTYAIGFSRTYAQLVGLDQADVIARVRDELTQDDAAQRYTPAGMAPGDAAKLPSRKLAWIAAVTALALAVGLAAFYNFYYRAGAPLPSLNALTDDGEGPANKGANNEGHTHQGQINEGQALPTLANLSADDQVIFTALENGIWVRFYDRDGPYLLEKQMAAGERFAVPQTAIEPRLNTGRPDALSITIGGVSVPKLSNQPQTIGNAAVSARALLARQSGPSTGLATGIATGVGGDQGIGGS